MLSGCEGENQMTEVTGGEEYWFLWSGWDQTTFRTGAEARIILKN